MLTRSLFANSSLRVATRQLTPHSTLVHRSHFSSSAVFKMPATAETASYRLNHTMFRIKDPEKSLKFYREVLGMDLIDEHDGGDFKLFFLAYGHQKVSRGEREGILELT